MQANAMPFCLVCYTLCSGFYFPMQEIYFRNRKQAIDGRSSQQIGPGNSHGHYLRRFRPANRHNTGSDHSRCHTRHASGRTVAEETNGGIEMKANQGNSFALSRWRALVTEAGEIPSRMACSDTENCRFERI